MPMFQQIMQIIELSAAGASQAIAPSSPTVAADLGLAAEFLAVVNLLIPHAKAAAGTASVTPAPGVAA